MCEICLSIATKVAALLLPLSPLSIRQNRSGIGGAGGEWANVPGALEISASSKREREENRQSGKGFFLAERASRRQRRRNWRGMEES